MANFAELDENNIVVNVLVVSNDILETKQILTTGEVITEDSQKGVDFLNDLYPNSGTWIQTSYNHNVRFNYAGVGYTYDAENDAFYEPRPYPSWTLDENFMWQPPTPMPNDDKLYEWNEETQAWDEIEMAGE
tara:strand:- start:999 stop:1394 length:396 start_codon:yes stop_codon:yes gene_type:complete